MSYDPHKMTALTKTELLKHGGHELKVFEGFINGTPIAVGIECITCRVPAEFGHFSKIIVKLPTKGRKRK